jgi:hypothetical protein
MATSLCEGAKREEGPLLINSVGALLVFINLLKFKEGGSNNNQCFSASECDKQGVFVKYICSGP